jgi:hypothetical protein
MVFRRLTAVLLIAWMSAGLALSDEAQRQKAHQAQKNGNYRDAYELYEKLTLDPKSDPKKVGDDLHRAIECLQRLNRTHEIDAYREQIIDVHKDNWRLLYAAAKSYTQVSAWGYMVAGEFHRGRHRGGGRVYNAQARDRVRALQLMTRAMKLADKEDNAREVAAFLLDFARMISQYRGYSQAWRLQYLTDLSKLPDYEPGYGRYYYYHGNKGAPVHPDGTPVYHDRPKTYEAAKTDGQRWRWLLFQAGELNASLLNQTRMIFANFLHNQFGVQTLAYYGRWFRPGRGQDEQETETGIMQLHTLDENETLAKLATGIKRFKLPDEFNFIKIYQLVAEDKDHGRSQSEQALNQLASLFENRRQYPKAAQYWKRNLREFGAGNHQWKRKRLDQIVGNWGKFEPTGVQPAGAGKGATLEFRFRNASGVTFEAHAVKIRQLLDDVKAYIRKRPNRLDWNKINITQIGWRLVQKKEKRYIGEKVAEWTQELKPRPNHFDKRITVATPLKQAGAYLLKAKLKDGNTSNIIVWLDDTVIVKKRLDKGVFFFVADAVTGKPVAKANVEFFGYRQKWVRSRTYRIDIENFAEFTDPDGRILLKPKTMPTHHRWLITATTKDGRFAYLGFTGVWYSDYHDYQYKQTKVFIITDRPVYRPDQTMKFKMWVRHARYDQEEASDFANKSFLVRIHDAKGDKIHEKQYKTDAYGGLDGEFFLKDEARLGRYRISLWQDPKHQLGSNGFRVEEYKKPEFEVTVEAPEKPAMLGEKIAATIKANYYFGAPVTKATVKYKVLRTSHDARWYPMMYWDWFYGRGYWWFAYDYTWYPGWARWGCPRPHWWWWPARREPPEVVMENEQKIGPDGTVRVEIDTTVAKEIHGDTDHKYEISAEVTDESRRTIVGKGDVMVARKPFRVYTWLDRGHYRVGDVIHASFRAQTLDNRPVQGDGKLTLYRVTYDKDLTPVETPVQTWDDLDTNEAGRAAVQIQAHKPGQYRLSYKVTDAKAHTMEGGYVFVIRGEGFDGSDFRFNHVEIVPDKKQYKPGEKAKLLVNTNRVGSTVLLFVRPSNGVYLPPKVLRLTGKSITEEVGVTKKDMPNFFVEAVTISGGNLYTETREIIVPPEKRVLNVDVQPSSKKYRPGEKATVTLKLTDLDDKPFVGSLAVAAYDKAVEYISGGSNVPEIKAFFWKWRRRHHPRTESSLSRYFRNVVPPNTITMAFLGVFGHSVADQTLQIDRQGGMVEKESLKQAANAARPAPGRVRRALAKAADGAPMADREFGADKKGEGGGRGDGGVETVEPTVRKKFADTALWKAALTTDEDGMARVEFTMPENLTGWKVKVWGLGHGTRVGQGEVEVVTFKNLLLRMQAPRFFVEKDEVVLSANVHNYLKNDKQVRAVLELDGDCLTALDAPEQQVAVKADGEQRVDWRVKVVKEGTAVVRMKALTDEESDAMQMSFPVYVHGMLKMEAWSGAIRPEQKQAAFDIHVPKERRIDQSRLEIRYSPTLAGAMVDALPYLVDYPHHTSDCELNRFLPTVITQKILLDMNLDLKAIQKKRTNLNAQEIGDDKERAKGWKHWARNPVFDRETVDDMVKAGLRKLTAMQLGDGGWGWFSGWGEHSSAHTTAYVVHGLQMARANDVAIVPGVLKRGVEWLKRYQAREVQKLKNAKTKTRPWKSHADNLDAFVFMVLVDEGVKNDDMHGFLYRDRTKLAVYANAMFGLALHKLEDKEKLDMVVRNIDQYLEQDDENQTAWLNLPQSNWWWCWYGSEYEAQAYYLKLLCRTDPKGIKASRLVKYLLNNRKHATYWNSPRDTAICVEAFAEYLQATGEHKPDLTVQVVIDGKKHKEVKITAENLFSFDNKLVVGGDAVTAGKHTIELRKTGKGPLYFNAYLTTFTLEDFIRRAGLEIKVRRNYYKLVKVDKTVKVAGARGQAVDQKVEKLERKPIKNLDTLKSGDLVEIELVIESKNDYEYIVFEDMKAAGFEPVQVRSGYHPDGPGAYMELRDERVCLYVRRLARGKHSIAYRMRAEIPGKFSALPTKAYAMYAPELKANSDEIKIKIED